MLSTYIKGLRYKLPKSDANKPSLSPSLSDYKPYYDYITYKYTSSEIANKSIDELRNDIIDKFFLQNSLPLKLEYFLYFSFPTLSIPKSNFISLDNKYYFVVESHSNLVSHILGTEFNLQKHEESVNNFRNGLLTSSDLKSTPDFLTNDNVTHYMQVYYRSILLSFNDPQLNKQYIHDFIWNVFVEYSYLTYKSEVPLYCSTCDHTSVHFHVPVIITSPKQLKHVVYCSECMKFQLDED